MRLNLVIDDKLMREALKATGAQTERSVVELGLRTLIQLHHQRKLRHLRGRVDWRGNLDAMRSDDQ